MTEEQRKRVIELVEQLNEMYLEVRSIDCRKESLKLEIEKREQELNRLKGSHR